MLAGRALQKADVPNRSGGIGGLVGVAGVIALSVAVLSFTHVRTTAG